MRKFLHRRQRWGGVRFAEFYEQVVVPLCPPDLASGQPATDPLRRALSSCAPRAAHAPALSLDELLRPDVLLAARLDGEPLPIEHGAPLRLIAPARYGYKSVKHLHRIKFWRSSDHDRPYDLRFMVPPERESPL